MARELRDSRHFVHLGETKNVVFADRSTKYLEEWDTDASDSDDEDSFAGSDTVPPKHVKFSNTIKYHKIISHKDFSPAERKSYWLTDRDMDRMTSERMKVLERHEKGKPCKGDMTYRGLECYTTQGGLHIETCIAVLVNSVIDEQERQWGLRSTDAARLARLSRRLSQSSALRARELAKSDSRDAARSWEKDSESKTCKKAAVKPVFRIPGINRPRVRTTVM